MIDLFYRDGRKLPEDMASRAKPTKRADTFTITESFPCSRCGGQGGSEAWKFTGYTCYQCGGRNSMGYHVRQTKLYTADRLAALRATAEKKAAKKRAEAKRKANAKRREFITWAKPHGKLIGRILLAAKPQGDTGEFITDLAGKLRRHWSLSDKQLAAAAKVLDARENRQRQDAASDHVGQIKDRIEFEGVIEFETDREGYYGTTHILKFRGDDGNVYTWFASGLQDLAKGDRVKVRGTVKKHDEFRGVKQTVLSRCIVEKFAVVTADEAANAEVLA